eukprot:jgi/Psemu1/50903/gm1.50903_g
MLPTNRTSPLFFLGDVGRRTHVGRACYRSISTGGDAVFRFPPLSGKILVVGDGDFAYSLACAKANESSGTARITASSLDSEKEVVRKYTSGKTNLDLLARSSGVTLRHELNATQPGSLGSKQAWDSIVWNFPYPPNSRRAEHREASALLTSFFQNARRSLKRDGTVYLAMSNRQEGMWGLGEVANACGFVLDGAKPFRASDIDGYVPKRSYVDEEIPSSVSSETTSSVFFLRLKSSESAITEEICTLLTKHNGQLYLANFKDAYQQCYGRLPFPGESRGLKKILANLSESGRQFQLMEEGTTSCRISLLAASSTSISTASSSSIPPAPSTPLTTSTTSTIEEEIRNLLDKNKGQLNLATFKNSYQQYYGRPFPPPGGGCSRKLKKRLHKLSGSGKNFLLKQEGTTSILCRCA